MCSKKKTDAISVQDEMGIRSMVEIRGIPRPVTATQCDNNDYGICKFQVTIKYGDDSTSLKRSKWLSENVKKNYTTMRVPVYNIQTGEVSDREFLYTFECQDEAMLFKMVWG